MSDKAYDPERLLAQIPALIDGEKKIETPQQLLRLLIHSIHTELGFRGDFKDELVYKHDRSSMSFEIGVSKVGGRLIVNAVAVEDNRTKTMDIVITDYFSSSSFPLAPKDCANGFASQARLKDLIMLYKTSVVDQLAPGLFKNGVTAEPTREDRGYRQDLGGPILPQQPPQAGPSRDRPPPQFNPYVPVGRSDLDPLGGMTGTTDPLRMRSPLQPDGMIVGPDHPIFRDRNQPAQPGQGIWGGDGFLPPGSVPPGARFDPIGPFGGNPRRGPNFGQNPGGVGPPNRLFRGEPDNDEFLPPRNSDYDSMFG